MISKILICPFFGALPEWWERYMENVQSHLAPQGYDMLVERDEDYFHDRVWDVLGIECPPMRGTGKVWDFRPALGLLYEDEIRGYDFWGHTDFDCVYGRVEQFVTDDFLSGIDMHSNCSSYVNGCWSLYRNTEQMRTLFQVDPFWGEHMTDPTPTGWAEESFSWVIAQEHEADHLVKAWTQWQTFEEADLARLSWEGDRLMCGEEETMMAHFRRKKVYPL